MPKVKPYEQRIPAFYRRSALDLMMFAHVNALIFVASKNKTEISIEDGIFDFLNFYGIDTNEYPIDSALTTYNRIRVNFIWTELKKTLDNKNNKT